MPVEKFNQSSHSVPENKIQEDQLAAILDFGPALLFERNLHLLNPNPQNKFQNQSANRYRPGGIVDVGRCWAMLVFERNLPLNGSPSRNHVLTSLI
jgi:hypothetical protein